MSEIIYKYEVPVPDDGFKVIINLPKFSKILSVQVQRGVPVLWALVNTEMPLEPRELEVIPTGVAIPKHTYDPVVERVHIGTFQIENGGFVFHLFEGKLRNSDLQG